MLFEIMTLFTISFVLIRVIKHHALKIGLVDVPNERSSHQKATPRGAGIGFTLAVLITLPLFHFEMVLTYIWVYFSIFLILIVGFLDDHKDTSPRTKFKVIIIATLLIALNHIVIDDIGIFFGYHISLGWLALPFTILAVVGFTNALNLIDGLDGLAGGIAMVIFTTLFYIGYSNHDSLIMYVSLGFLTALSAFLIFNWNPASIFMGDSGSLVLGFVIALLSIKALAYLPAVSILFLAAIPNMDVLIVLFRRKLHHRPVFCADKCHFHHILHQFFEYNTQKTVFFLIVLQMVYSLTGLQLDKETDEGFLLVLFILNVILLYWVLSAMLRKQKRDC